MYDARPVSSVKGRNVPIIHGVDSTGKQIPLLVDASGRPLVLSHGWVNGAAYKQPIILGYSGDYSQEVSDLNAAAGTVTLTGTTVPAGEIWDVQAIFGLDVQTNVTYLSLRITVNAIPIALIRAASPGINIPVVWNGHIILSEGDSVNAQFIGTVLGDDIYLRYHAVRIDIDQ